MKKKQWFAHPWLSLLLGTNWLLLDSTLPESHSSCPLCKASTDGATRI